MKPKKYILPLLLLVTLITSLGGIKVPPHPSYRQVPTAWAASDKRMPLPEDGLFAKRTGELPNNILVLRVQFSDLYFINTPEYPDYLSHDDEFFDRWMIHLTDFFAEASHFDYILEYHLYPQVITLPRPLAYYGADTPERIDGRIGEFALDVKDAVDDEIDFSQYGGIIIFHAGAGQESDVDAKHTEQIWSTFLTRKSLQSHLDPDNDDYPGLETNDGVHLTNIVIIAEHEFQDYFPAEGEPDAEVYLFSIYGVLAHQFGHVLGLPTLFDNDSSDGASQGIGNWGLMGTGVWNASGYVPAQLSAFSRLFLGWEDPIVVSGDMDALPVDYWLDHSPYARRLYKVPISETEYYLIENRQQNPDGSLDPYNNQPSFSFKLLEEGEQDYYEEAPLLPYFNFMKNRYAGCEWDFFLPGLGGPFPPGQAILQDGSGLLIWHIDEEVIAQKFTPNFDLNRINGNAHHKGVDLEEADGIQHLDSSVYDIYKWGSPFDAFRYGNNDYFGHPMHDGIMSLPTAESYYGGIPLEIYDISHSSNRMSFSVRFSWRLSSEYEGENPINAAFIDLDGDGEDELFYAMPNGYIYVWKDDILMPGYPKRRLPVHNHYTWDGQHLYIPMQLENISRLHRMDANGSLYLFTAFDQYWASHPVDCDSHLYLPINTPQGGILYRHHKDSGETSEELTFDHPIATNLIWDQERLAILTREPDSYYRLWRYHPQTGELGSLLLDIPADSTVVGMFQTSLKADEDTHFIIQCTNSMYVFNEDGEPLPGFPFIHDAICTAPLTLADFDQNGYLDIILGCENGVIMIDYSGQLMSPESLIGDSSEEGGFSSGALAVDLDGDGSPELLGCFGHNQLKVYNNDYRLQRGYPVSFATRSRNLPLLGRNAEGNGYIYTVSDNGSVYRKDLPPDATFHLDDIWHTEYANLQRTACFFPGEMPNTYNTTSLFVKDEVYIYPNPLKSIYGNQINLSIMTNTDAALDVRIYDIGGNLVFSEKGRTKAYLKNRKAINIPAHKLKTGVYIAVVKANNESRRIKFAVEK